MEQKTIQTAAQKKAAVSGKSHTIQDYIKIMEPEIKKALPSVITPERFTRMVLSALSVNPTLASCTPKSFLGAMMTAAQLGVEPNTALGQAWLIPYRNHGVLECQFQLGTKGLVDLAYRSGEVSIVDAHEVRENDEFEYEFGLDPKLHHKPARQDRGRSIAYYGMFRTKNGGYGFCVMSYDDVLEHAKKYSKSFVNGPWQTNFDEMAKKTVLKRALKYSPLRSDFARQLSSDETIKSNISDDMYSVPDETIYAEFDVKDAEDANSSHEDIANAE